VEGLCKVRPLKLTLHNDKCASDRTVLMTWIEDKGEVKDWVEGASSTFNKMDEERPWWGETGADC
jgi:hypothetical protein